MNGRRIAGAAALLSAGWLGGAVAGPISFNTAMPVAEGELVWREQALAMRSGRDPAGAGRELAVDGLVTMLAWGATDKLALIAAQPWLAERLTLREGGGERSAEGFGDLTVFGRHTLYQHDRPGRTFRVGGFAGVEAPTGADGERDALGPLPPPLQPGSGSWDGFAGAVATLQTLDYQIDGQLSYRANGEGHGFEAGDEWHLDASLQYRLWPSELGGGVPGFVYGVLELNAVRRGRDRMAGIAAGDSGGTTVFLSPGLQYVGKRWVWEALLQKPVAQDLHGAALETGWVARTGFSVNF